MGYRRFRLQLDRFDPATVATIATDPTERSKSVADVASVAAVLPLANTILSGYRALLTASARGAVERQIRVVECFLDIHLATAAASAGTMRNSSAAIPKAHSPQCGTTAWAP